MQQTLSRKVALVRAGRLLGSGLMRLRCRLNSGGNGSSGRVVGMARKRQPRSEMRTRMSM